MNTRALMFGLALATCDAIRTFFHRRHPTAIIHILRKIPEPQYIYMNVDEKVFPLKLHD